MCSCGCNQTLSRRQVQRHMQKRVVPRLVTAAVAQFRTLGTTVSAPRLNPSKKLRTSRRHVSSSPESSDKDMVTDQPPLYAPEDEINQGFQEDENEIVLHAIGRSQQGIWSGRHHVVGLGDSETDGSDDEVNGSEAGESSESESYDDWEMDEGNPSDLSALDRLGEDFERKVVANGESLSLKQQRCNS